MALRVLITADAVGGVWQYATDLARELAGLGMAPTLALLGPPPSAAQRTAADGLTLIETGLPLDWLSDRPEPVVAAGEAIARLAADFDLAQLNMPTLGAATFPVPVVAVAHGCVATWWEATLAGNLPRELAWQRDLTGRGLANADLVAAPTRAYAEAVRRRYRLKARPAVVHNGRRPLTRAARPGSPVPAVLTVGRLWDQAKDARLLDRVAGRIRAPFAAAGALAGPHGETFAPEHLRSLGHLAETELVAILGERPIFASAARFEPFGLAVLEAAQAGCPLVLADIPTFRELWDGAARFVMPGNEDGFVAALRELLDDAAEAHRLGETAEARAACYTPEEMARGMAALYAQLLPAADRARAAA